MLLLVGGPRNGDHQDYRNWGDLIRFPDGSEYVRMYNPDRYEFDPPK